MKNIILFSDGHGSLPRIPKKFRNAETIVIFAGDQNPNFLENFKPGILEKGEFKETSWNGFWNFRLIDKEAEAKQQAEWLEHTFIPNLLSQEISLDRIIFINGNHDFADPTHLFKHSCFNSAKTITIDDIKIGLLVGVLPLTYEWFEEISENEIANRINLLDPEIQILVSHGPCYSVHDKAYGEEHIGSQELYKAIFGSSIFDPQPPKFNNLKFVLTGHSHKWPNIGVKKHEINGRIVRFCNAAETRLELLYKN